MTMVVKRTLTKRFRATKKGEHRGGRKKGVPNRMTRLIKEAIVTACSNVGFPTMEIIRKAGFEPIQRWKSSGKGGLIGYLQWLALHHPASATAILGKVLPMQIVTQHLDEETLTEHVEYESVDDAKRAMADCGLTEKSLLLLLENHGLNKRPTTIDQDGNADMADIEGEDDDRRDR